MYTTVISAADLQSNLHQTNWLIVDCRHQLGDPQAGRNAYQNGHISDAIFAHLDEDLSGPIIPGTTGRHPLPSDADMTALFSRWGISPTTQVVAYDDKNGAIAARLWWMLRYMGHEAVAVLDGGLGVWEAAGGRLECQEKVLIPTPFQATPNPSWIRDRFAVSDYKDGDGNMLVDSRAAERYRGEVEPIDPIAGHIPGAYNHPFAYNWTEDGLLKSPEKLREQFDSFSRAEQVTFYCGSGVTACYNLLAYKHAGLGDAKLYPGSWSEWITVA